MFGAMQMGYGNEAFRVTDVEKTLLDCFDLPQYSGGYAELIRTFHAAKMSSIRLLEYFSFCFPCRQRADTTKITIIYFFISVKLIKIKIKKEYCILKNTIPTFFVFCKIQFVSLQKF